MRMKETTAAQGFLGPGLQSLGFRRVLSGAFCYGGYGDAESSRRHCHHPPEMKEIVMARRSVLPAGIAPRGLNLDQASEYWGCCPSTFKRLMKLGIVQPIDMAGIERNVFDREALDAMMSARAQQCNEVTQ